MTGPVTSALFAIQSSAGAMPDEPGATALLLVTFGALLAVSVLFSGAAQKVSVPVLLIFLVIGILAGSEGLGGIDFEDYAFSYRLGSIGLMLILFDGGLNTPLGSVRRYLGPASVLATIGVVGTAGLIAVGAHWVGFAWPHALLLGAIVSSTDAAAVFSVLRGSGLHLKRRVGVTLEVESGINDPMAVILTTVLTAALVSPGEMTGWRLMFDVVTQMVVGGVGGLAIGYGGRALLARLRLSAGGLYPAAMLALACLAFALPTLLGGSGFLAVYLTGVVLGNGELPYRAGLLRVHDALAWLSQIGLFLLLGLLVFPSRLGEVALPGLGLALFATFVARPLVVWICLLPFRYPWLDVVYIGYVGLRGAVPIVLATFPVLAGAPGAESIFDVVFFVVVTSAIVPGATVPWVTRRFGLESSDPPAPQAVLEIESRQQLSGRLMSFYIDDALAVANTAIADLPFPDGAAATLIVRGDELIAPKGATHLSPGDHVYIFARPEDEPFIRLMFGRPESE